MPDENTATVTNSTGLAAAAGAAINAAGGAAITAGLTALSTGTVAGETVGQELAAAAGAAGTAAAQSLAQQVATLGIPEAVTFLAGKMDEFNAAVATAHAAVQKYEAGHPATVAAIGILKKWFPKETALIDAAT